ncbi:MAG: hypothetical protein ACM3WU_00355 [Bacillota bacterium]
MDGLQSGAVIYSLRLWDSHHGKEVFAVTGISTVAAGTEFRYEVGLA